MLNNIEYIIAGTIAVIMSITFVWLVIKTIKEIIKLLLFNN